MTPITIIFCILLSATIVLMSYAMILHDENADLKKRVYALESHLMLRNRPKPGGQKHAK